MKYRRRTELVAEVLSASLKGAKKTHIMNRGNLSFKMLNYYLKVVLSSGLLIFDSTNGSYFVTDKGKRFLVVYNRYKRHLSNAEKKLRIIKNQKDQLEKMCATVDTCNNSTAKTNRRNPNRKRRNTHLISPSF